MQQAPYRPRNYTGGQPDEGEQTEKPQHDFVNQSLPITIPVTSVRPGNRDAVRLYPVDGADRFWRASDSADLTDVDDVGPVARIPDHRDGLSFIRQRRV